VNVVSTVHDPGAIIGAPVVHPFVAPLTALKYGGFPEREKPVNVHEPVKTLNVTVITGLGTPTA
jgi:hypothetical protein